MALTPQKRVRNYKSVANIIEPLKAISISVVVVLLAMALF
jgi:hypothetical protein